MLLFFYIDIPTVISKSGFVIYKIKTKISKIHIKILKFYYSDVYLNQFSNSILF